VADIPLVDGPASLCSGAAAQKLEAMRAARATPVLLGMPDIRSAAGRSSAG
jgi:hypothetical protein